MLKSLALISLLATAAAASAQSPDLAPQAPPTSAPAQAAAPIVRAYQTNPAPQPPQANSSTGPYEDQGPANTRGPLARRSRRPEQDQSQLVDSQPISGVWLRSNSSSVIRTISATPQGTEVRVERGVLNVNVHQPAVHSAIFIDLPGGQVSLLKDGLYTFNADTNTVRVLHGEAAAFPNHSGVTPVADTDTKQDKGIRIKEDHQLSFAPNSGGGPLKTVEAYPYELTADLLPMGNGDGRAYANYSGDDGPYAYPYYAGAYGYSGFYPGYYPGYWGFGYPYSYGIGIGYYGGFRRGFGGYRGGYRGGLRGGFRR